MQHYTASLHMAGMIAGVAGLLVLPLVSTAQAQQSPRGNTWVRSDWNQHARDNASRQDCRLVDPVSLRCVNFHSDSTWPEGFPDYHGSNGG